MSDPQSYRGPLTTAQIAAGMNCASANARRLADDAQLLLSNGRWPTATSLAILSIEESGKVVILRRFLTCAESGLKGLWKEYRSHTKKNLNWIFPDLVAKGARSPRDFAPIVDAKAEHPQIIDVLKQLGFYTDCLGNAHWSIPADVIEEKTAVGMVGTARLLASEKPVTERELELWVEHLGPVWMQSNELMLKGLGHWYAAMQAEGLMPPGENKMETFVGKGLSLEQVRVFERGDSKP